MNVYPFKQYIKEPESNGKYKIIQQGNEPIIGYANGKPFEEYENIVLFGDHTVSLYKPQAPFFVATDGVKILGTTKNLDGNFFNATLEKYKPESEGYKRHFSILKKQRACFTENSDEQRRVGNFFKNLDHLITLHQRKLFEAKNNPKNGSKNFFRKIYQKLYKFDFNFKTYDWEQRKLMSTIRSITDFRGRTPKKLGLDWSDNGYLALSALNVKNGYIDFSQDAHYGNQELYDRWMGGKELYKNQVLFTTEAPMGNVAQVPDNNGYILSQRTIAFEVNEEYITDDFLATVLRSPVVFSALTALSSGGTAKGVSQRTLNSLDFSIPKDTIEQTKIANYFNALNHLITLHQREVFYTLKHIFYKVL